MPGENGYEYEAVFASGLATATTTSARLTVDSITADSNPRSQTVFAGGGVTFTASATGEPSPTVQWELSTDGGTTFSAISGATSTTYAFTATALETGYEYEAVFTSGLATATTAAATLTVAAGLEIIGAPDGSVQAGPIGGLQGDDQQERVEVVEVDVYGNPIITDSSSVITMTLRGWQRSRPAAGDYFADRKRRVRGLHQPGDRPGRDQLYPRGQRRRIGVRAVGSISGRRGLAQSSW